MTTMLHLSRLTHDRKTPGKTGRVILCAAAMIVSLAFDASAQPAGGKTTGSGATPNTNANTRTTPAKPAKTSTATSSKGRTSGTPPSIDGKWWTSGNDFGAGEVVFTQSGASVAGVIRYSEGGTGNVTGTMGGNKRLQFTFADASGRTGSGWLELSWNNFLGGPWRNARVRDGSWTMMRIEGKWCFGGSRNRIRTVTHNEREK
jgi:hypothetical protein